MLINAATPDDCVLYQQLWRRTRAFFFTFARREASISIKKINALLDELLDSFPAAFDNPWIST